MRNLTAKTSSAGESHGSAISYVAGYILSLILTIIPFYMVLGHQFAVSTTVIIIFVAAFLQLLVQLIFFLHLNGSSEARWNVMSFIFTLLMVLIVVVGSLWIMYNMNYNMMH